VFDNPEKLFIILVIALLVLGPQKLMGLGGSLGKAIRDFRGSIRDAQDSFRDAMDEASKPEDDPTAPALPAPDPAVPSVIFPETPMPAAASDANAHDPLSEDEERDSLASEPSARAVQELLPRKE